jgi:isoleucyl-tRNA synthetase
MDKLFGDLNQATQKTKLESVHLAEWPKAKKEAIDTVLEEQMRLAQDLTSMVFSLRKKENLRVRQPLQKMMVPVLNDKVKRQVESIKDLVLSEVNVKELEFMTSDSGILVKKIKPNFKTLGPKFGQQMKAISQAISQFSSEDISTIEQEESYPLNIGDSEIQIELSDVIITTEDIPGWVVTSMNGNTVALDISLSEGLISEGLAREVINRIQNLRKDQGFEVTDRIEITLSAEEKLATAINNNLNYICSETLADEIRITSYDSLENGQELELTEGVYTRIELLKR